MEAAQAAGELKTGEAEREMDNGRENEDPAFWLDGEDSDDEDEESGSPQFGQGWTCCSDDSDINDDDEDNEEGCAVFWLVELLIEGNLTTANRVAPSTKPQTVSERGSWWDKVRPCQRRKRE